MKTLLSSAYRVVNFPLYVLTCFACFLFGALCEGTPAAPPGQASAGPTDLIITKYITGFGLACIILFFATITSFYVVRTTVIDDNKISRKKYALLISIAIFILGIVIASSVNDLSMKGFIFRYLSIFLPLLLYTAFNLWGNLGRRYRTKFENKVFFPVFFVCASSIAFGITVQYLLEGSHPADRMIAGVDTNMKFCWVVCGAQLLNFLLYWFPSNPTARTYIHIAIPVSVILLSFAANIWLAGDEGKYGIAIYSLAYSLGLAQSIKSMSLLLEGSVEQKKEALRFYFPAINWAMAAIPFGSLIMPALFKEMTYPPILLYSAIVSIGWQFTSNSNKTTPYVAFLMAGALSGLCLSSFLASAWGWGFVTNIFSIPAKIGDDYWLSSIIGTFSTLGISATLIRLIKDILGLELSNYYKNFSRARIYYEFVGPFMLMLTASFLLCVANVIFWLTVVIYFQFEQGEKFYLQERMTVSCAGSIIICLLAIITLFIRQTVMIGAIAEAGEIKRGMFPAAPRILDETPLEQQTVAELHEKRRTVKFRELLDGQPGSS